VGFSQPPGNFLKGVSSDPSNLVPFLNDSTQPTEPSRPSFASTLKLGLGSHGSDFKSTLDSKPGPQHGFSQPPGNFLKEVSSSPSNLTHLL